MKKNLKKSIIASVIVVGLFSSCSSERVVPGNVYSNEDYEMMGKQVAFSEYGFNALDKRTKIKVEKQRLKFLNAVDDYFMADNNNVNGVLSIYDNER